MALTVIATPGAANANSYLTLAEAQTYFDSRLFSDAWTNSPDQNVALVMATRILDALAQPFKTLMPEQNGVPAYYRVRRQWTGTRSTSTQALAWPRTNMVDANGNIIDSSVVPQDLKNATAELAMQLSSTDRTLDNDVITGGITAVRTGSVSVSFKQNITPQVIPDAVYNLMPQSWLTDELFILANAAFFDVASGDPTHDSKEYGW